MNFAIKNSNSLKIILSTDIYCLFIFTTIYIYCLFIFNACLYLLSVYFIN